MIIHLPVRLIIEEASLRVHEMLEKEGVFLPAPCIRYQIAIELERQLREMGAEGLEVIQEIQKFLWTERCKNIVMHDKDHIIKEAVNKTLDEYIKLMSVPSKRNITDEEIMTFFLNAPIVGMELIQAKVIIKKERLD